MSKFYPVHITLQFERDNDTQTTTYESYKNEFTILEEEMSLNEIFTRFENMLSALGYVFDGQCVNLVRSPMNPQSDNVTTLFE